MGLIRRWRHRRQDKRCARGEHVDDGSLGRMLGDYEPMLITHWFEKTCAHCGETYMVGRRITML